MSYENIYYLMQVNFAKNNIPRMYKLAQRFTSDRLFNAETPEIAEAIQSLLEKISNLDEDGEFRMNFGECALVYHIMAKVQIALHTMFPILKQKEAKEKLPISRESALKANADLGQLIDDIIDDMCETFPDFRPEVVRFRKHLHMIDLSFRKMEVDNEYPIIRFHLKEGIEQKFFLLIFQVFDLIIMKSENEFSETVREAHFFYESDFQEVFERVKETINSNATEIDLTLRDAVVVYTAGNITQKLFLTDAGDEIMTIFNRVSVDVANDMSAIDLRSLYLQLAARINEVIEENAIDEETLTAFIEPVKEFAV